MLDQSLEFRLGRTWDYIPRIWLRRWERLMYGVCSRVVVRMYQIKDANYKGHKWHSKLIYPCVYVQNQYHFWSLDIVYTTIVPHSYSSTSKIRFPTLIPSPRKGPLVILSLVFLLLIKNKSFSWHLLPFNLLLVRNSQWQQLIQEFFFLHMRCTLSLIYLHKYFFLTFWDNLQNTLFSHLKNK